MRSTRQWARRWASCMCNPHSPPNRRRRCSNWCRICRQRSRRGWKKIGLDERGNQTTRTGKSGPASRRRSVTGTSGAIGRGWKRVATNFFGQHAGCAGIQLPLHAGQDRQAGRQARVAYDPANGECVLQRHPQRDRVSGRDPAATVLRPQGRSSLELWWHRCGDRARNDARLRRFRQPVRCQGQLRHLVDRRGPQVVHRAHRSAGGAVRRL